MKILYAFIWQEDLVEVDFLYNSWGLWIGGVLIAPVWNKISSFISGFAQPDLSDSLYLYPGQS